MKNLLSLGTSVLVVNWNMYLAIQMEKILHNMARDCGASDYSYSVVTRNYNEPERGRWLVSPDRAWDYYEFMKPQVVVHDPFGVGEPPNPYGEYEDGMSLLLEFDRSPSCQQIVWTSFPAYLLPTVNNSLYLAQGQSVTEVFKSMENIIFN